MNLHIAFRIAPVALSLSLAAVGCGGNGEPADSADSDPDHAAAEMDGGPPDTTGGHEHPSEGPHHGSLIELGNEEYHAELVHDDEAGTVTIYVLDSSAKEAVPIDARELTINLKHEGRPVQFKLAAAPDEGDPQGKSSRFVSNDKELAEHLDHEDSGARLMLTIGGKSYNGLVAHEHDHAHGGH